MAKINKIFKELSKMVKKLTHIMVLVGIFSVTLGLTASPASQPNNSDTLTTDGSWPLPGLIRRSGVTAASLSGEVASLATDRRTPSSALKGEDDPRPLCPPFCGEPPQ